jgi:superfamily II DNA/RNA helicase
MSPTFAQLGVPAPICEALARRGVVHPFEIQAATIADALAGRDVCGRAPTGSGKTLAFGIPLVATVGVGRPNRPRGLVLAPTRELADQITSQLKAIAGSVRVGVVYGGVGYGAQRKDLRRGIDILVACPGRLEDLIAQNSVQLDDVDRVVVDEADRMADMGFLPAVKRLLDRTAKGRQTVLFSATLDGDVATLTSRYQRDPVRHEVGDASPDITAAEHLFWKVAGPDRLQVTAAVVNGSSPALIFCRTRHGADRLARQLAQRGVGTAALHGGRSQAQRTRALDQFHAGRVAALVATDVAARGIHVDGIATVIHFDPPADHKTYIHRSGRTARAGLGGRVISLVQADGMRDARRMQREIGLEEKIGEPHGIGSAERTPLAAPAATDTRPARDERPPRADSRPARYRGETRTSRGGQRSRPRGNRTRRAVR